MKEPAKKTAPEKAASAPKSASTSYDAQWLLGLYRRMVLIRQFEDRVKYLFLEGVMPGTIHQYQGQEACGVGVCAALRADDVITTTHRPHGHCISKGMNVNSAMAELFGKVTGCCKGKGGSMHMGDLSLGIVPAVAIVGGGLPLTTGMALSFKMRKQPRVAVGFMGDGATNEGAFHEAVNMSAIWDLPVLWVVENNFYGASTKVEMVVKTKHISDRACAYGIPGLTIDGNDVLAVYEAAREAVDRARSGKGPTLLELLTYRITGHSRRDPCLYQPEEERKKALANEPIGRFARHLLAKGIADQKSLDGILESVKAEIETAVTRAMSDPEPRPEDALEDMFV
jgi:pyruvate dehydrogenase E1 component alpha subunit